MEEPVEITSSDPISITTTVAPTIVQDEEEDIEELILEQEARLNLALLFQARKRSGATMSEVGAARTPPRVTLDPMDVDRQSAPMLEDDDPGPTQVVERQGKKQKPNDAHQALSDAAAERQYRESCNKCRSTNDRCMTTMKEEK